MISAVAILMLCNGIRMSLKSKKNTINEIGCVMNSMTHLFRFFIFSFLHFFVSSFFSSDFTDESEAFLLIGLLTEFRGYLASGQWLAPYICSCCFCHADFADGADFSSWGLFCPTDFADIHRFFFVGDYFVPQISQIYADFSLWRLFRPTDFTDDTDFSLWDIFQFQGVSAPTGQVASAKIRD